MTLQLARLIDVLAIGFAFGATAWFFFVQSPVLVKKLGRDRFVPLQMRLAVTLFKTLMVAGVVMIAAALAQGHGLMSLPVVTGMVAVFGAAVNSLVLVPRALKAGGQSLKEEKSAEAQSSIGRFASDGGGEATRLLHRLVVVFVVVMLAGVLPHAWALVAV